MSVPPLSLAAIRQPAFLYYADGRIAEANGLAEALAGRPLAGRTLAAVIGVFDARSPDGTPLLAVDMPSARALAGEESVDVPLVVRAADGRTLHVLATAAPIRNGGEVVGALSIWQDISARERMRAEAETAAEELRVTEEELRAGEEELLQQGSELVRAVSDLERQQRLLDGILGAKPHHVSLWDRDQRLVWANERFAADLGEPREALVGRTWRELWRDAPVVAPLVDGALQSVAAGAPYTSEVEEVGSEGRWRAATFLPIFGNQVLVIIEDITERKRAEEALRKSEAEYRHLVDYAPTGIYEIEYAGPRLRHVNDAMCRILGYTKEELLAVDPTDLLDTESQARFQERVRTVLAGEPIDESVAFRVFGKDGREFWAALNVKPTYTDGKVDGALVVAHDITERKRSEEELRYQNEKLMAIEAELRQRNDDLLAAEHRIRESEERFRLALRNAPVSVSMQDRDLRYVWAYNQRTARPEEIIGRLDIEIFTPEEAARLGEIKRRVLAEDVEIREQMWLDRPGGRMYLDVYFEPIHDDAGRVRGVGTATLDLTQMKLAEEAMHQSRTRLQGALASMTDAVFISDVEGRFVEVNEAFATFHRFGSRDECLWTLAEYPDILDVFLPDGTLAPLNMWAVPRALRGETATDAEYILRRKDTGETWIGSYSFGPIRDSRGAIVGSVVTGRDITERKEAEEALRETRDYLDNLINYANAQIIVWNPDLRITRFNAAFEHLSGYGADEVIGRELFVLFPVDSREESLEKIQHTITEQWQAVEIPILRPDGGVRIALWNSANIYDKEGTALLATIAQGQDITQRKEVEEALRSYVEALRRSNEDLERYAYVSSHDLQEPLRAIVSFSQLLERRYKGRLDTDADDYINFIVEGGIRMQTLIQDLLAYSRVNTTKQELRPTDMEDVMVAVERNLDLQLREAGGVITHDAMPMVLADPIQLEQVFANLVGNAIKFRRPDEPLRIHVGARRTDGFWEFAVSDNGIGIEPEYFERIFVIFQRLHTKDAYPGTGIGLAIVKRIIDRHGGQIGVESVPGEGSTLYFTLPAA